MTKETDKVKPKPIYEMGNSMPRCYISPSGIDCQIKFEDELLGLVQSIEFIVMQGQMGFGAEQENKITFITMFTKSNDPNFKEVIKQSENEKKWAIGGMVNKTGVLEVRCDARSATCSQVIQLRRMKVKFTEFKQEIGVDTLICDYYYKFDILEELE